MFHIVATRTLALVVLCLACAAPSGGLRAQEAGTAPDRRAALESKIREVYANLSAPAPSRIIAGEQDVSHLFAETVRGRVAPMGQFPGFESALEYFYGFATTPGITVPEVRFNALITEKDKVAVEIEIDFDATGSLVGRTFTLTHVGIFDFDRDLRIESFDLTIPNLGAAVDPRYPGEAALRMLGVCAQLTLGGLGGTPASCPAEFDGETSAERFRDCFRFMRSIPFGSYNRANSNTFACRELHSLLTPLRPDIHCPHTGKSGGMTCVDVSYESYYDEDF